MLDQFACTLKVRVDLPERKRRGAVALRLYHLGHGIVCTRCGGTGHFSFNLMDGTRCFKCGGAKYTMPKLSPRLLAVVQADVAEGKLEPYLKEVRDRSMAKRACDIVMAAWEATGISKKYDWRKSAADKAAGVDSEDVRISNLNARMCEQYTQVENAVRAYLSSEHQRQKTGKADGPTAEEIARLTEGAVKEIQELGANI